MTGLGKFAISALEAVRSGQRVIWVGFQGTLDGEDKMWRGDFWREMLPAM